MVIQPFQPCFYGQIGQRCAVLSCVGQLHGGVSPSIEPVLDLGIKDAIKTKSLMLLHVAKLIAKLELGIVVLVEVKFLVLLLRLDVDVRFVVLFLLCNEKLAGVLVFNGLLLIYSFTEIDDAGASEEFDVWIHLLNTLHKSDISISGSLYIVN